MRKKLGLFVSVLSLSGIMVFMQNCGQDVTFKEGVAESVITPQSSEPTPVSEVVAEQTLPQKQALAYGADAQDRQLLADKIAGYQAPGMQEIFNRWRRISGSTTYKTGADIIPDAAISYCYTGIDANGKWMQGTNTAGKKIDPTYETACISSDSFCAASWTYLMASNRLRNASNADRFTGFVSAIKFDNYVNQATVTSADNDDDTIALIIAAKIDIDGTIHTLSAARTQGGVVAAPQKGWAVVYRKNNAVIKVFGEKVVGGTNANHGGDNGDKKGWSGRTSRIRVERTGNKIEAYASEWGTIANTPAVLASSKIALDFDDATLGLTMFQGAQYYGYGMQSQAGAEFVDIEFTTTTDQKVLFDLVNDVIYDQQSNGRYTARANAKAFDVLGFPSLVSNTETQKQFHLKADRSFILK